MTEFKPDNPEDEAVVGLYKSLELPDGLIGGLVVGTVLICVLVSTLLPSPSGILVSALGTVSESDEPESTLSIVGDSSIATCPNTGCVNDETVPNANKPIAVFLNPFILPNGSSIQDINYEFPQLSVEAIREATFYPVFNK